MNSAKKLLMALTLALFVPAAVSAGHHGTKKDIVDVAVANGSFNTLIAAAKAAGLVEVL